MPKSLLTSRSLANRQFRMFFWGRTISLFGSGMTPVALAFAVLAAPHGPQLLGYILAAEILPNVLIVLVGGSLADRYRRDRLIQVGNLGAGATAAAIAALVLTGANSIGLFPFAIANGALAAFTSPALRGIVPEIVASGRLTEANALLNTARSVAKIVGPAAAGILVATVGGGWSIALDALSFFIAAAFMARLRIPARPAPDATPKLGQPLREGWGYFYRQRPIFLVTGAYAGINLANMGVWRVLGPVIAAATFGPAAWGLALSLQAVGLLAASLLLVRAVPQHPFRDGMLAGAALGFPLLALGEHPGLIYPYAAAAVAGVGSAIAAVTWDTLALVFAFGDVGSYITIPLAVIAAIPVANRWGLYPVATGGGVLLMVSALLPLANRAVRTTRLEQLNRDPLTGPGLGTLSEGAGGQRSGSPT